VSDVTDADRIADLQTVLRRIPFFHGGPRGLKVGDYILPPSLTGAPWWPRWRTGEDGSEHCTYGDTPPTMITFTPVPSVAAVFATLRRGQFYLVQPLDRIDVDPDAWTRRPFALADPERTRDAGEPSFCASSARILGVYDVCAGDHIRAVTLSHSITQWPRVASEPDHTRPPRRRAPARDTGATLEHLEELINEIAWWHGGVAGLHPGDRVLPADQIDEPYLFGQTRHADRVDADCVYITPWAYTASAYALLRERLTGASTALYRVRPGRIWHQAREQRNAWHTHPEARCDYATVASEVPIREDARVLASWARLCREFLDFTDPALGSPVAIRPDLLRGCYGTVLLARP
jgi:hypothetical protein